MRNKRTFLFMGLVFGLALVFGTTTGAMAENIRIGVASPFTGDLAAYGDNVKAGVSLNLKEINDAGGINGQKIELVWGDDLCAPKDAGTVGSKFAADKSIVAVIGHLCSSATLAAMPIYVRAGVPAISPTSTNPTIGDEYRFYVAFPCGQTKGVDIDTQRKTAEQAYAKYNINVPPERDPSWHPMWVLVYEGTSYRLGGPEEKDAEALYELFVSNFKESYPVLLTKISQGNQT